MLRSLSLKTKERKRSEREQKCFSALIPSSTNTISPVGGAANQDIDYLMKNCFKQDDFINRLVSKLAKEVRHALEEDLANSLRKMESEINQLKEDLGALKTEVNDIKTYLATKNDDWGEFSKKNNYRLIKILDDDYEDLDDLVSRIY